MKCVPSFSCSFCLFAFLRKYFPRRQFDKILGLCRSHSWNANSTLKTFLLQSSAIETDWSKKAFWRKILLKCCNNLSKESLQQNLYWKRVAPSARGERNLILQQKRNIKTTTMNNNNDGHNHSSYHILA